MKSKTGGKSILEVEVTNISIHGFWILIGEKEYFLSFTDFPWFRDATIAEITDVTIVKKEHLFWEKLDIDLTLNMIENPENYPLISK
jgi:hypothetical protein